MADSVKPADAAADIPADLKAQMEDVCERVTSAFVRIERERMTGVPILNARLAVEVVGLRDWNAHWLFVLVTPWSINLMMMPQDTACSWSGLKIGETMLHRFPSGRFGFIVGEETGLGRYLMCSLFSPVLEFEDQEAARLVGVASIEALFDLTLDPDYEKEAGAASSSTAANAGDAKPVALSRRGFLSGRSSSTEGA